MILTQDKINNAIIKATCAMADKSSKYYRGLAVGTKNDCLFKEASLLKEYIDSLQCFKIVGSTEQCNCIIEGEYTFISDSITLGEVQFLCDGTGYWYPDDTSFIYDYDSFNNNLIWNINGVILVYTDITFLDDCSFTGNYDGSFFEFVKTNPCTPTVIEQTCLTNEQVITIINNINNITQ
jgi:hypothetical protein